MPASADISFRLCPPRASRSRRSTHRTESTCAVTAAAARNFGVPLALPAATSAYTLVVLPMSACDAASAHYPTDPMARSWARLINCS